MAKSKATTSTSKSTKTSTDKIVDESDNKELLPDNNDEMETSSKAETEEPGKEDESAEQNDSDESSAEAEDDSAEDAEDDSATDIAEKIKNDLESLTKSGETLISRLYRRTIDKDNGWISVVFHTFIEQEYEDEGEYFVRFTSDRLNDNRPMHYHAAKPERLKQLLPHLSKQIDRMVDDHELEEVYIGEKNPTWVKDGRRLPLRVSAEDKLTPKDEWSDTKRESSAKGNGTEGEWLTYRGFLIFKHTWLTSNKATYKKIQHDGKVTNIHNGKAFPVDTSQAEIDAYFRAMDNSDEYQNAVSSRFASLEGFE